VDPIDSWLYLAPAGGMLGADGLFNLRLRNEIYMFGGYAF
jgi:hypothetical protein